MHTHQEIHIEGVDTHAAIHIDIGRGEEVLDVFDIEPCLFLYLTTHTLLYGLIHVAETARQVEGSLGGFLGTSDNQQLIVVVDDECCRSRAGIGVVSETTVPALLALEVVHLKVRTATNGTVLEYL